MIATSGAQYLRPEYLNPIQGNSVELDAKKSPLALLAQTCSQIGADLPKSAQSVPEKTKGKSSPITKTPSHSPAEDKASFKPYEKKEEEDRLTPRRTTPVARSPTDVRSQSRNSDSGRKSDVSVSKSSPQAKTPQSISSLGDLSKDPLAAYKLNPGLYSHLGLGLDPLATAGLSALTAKVSSTTAASQSLANPYVGYARVKTVSGSETIIPVCRDPYCTGCQINTHALQVINETCPTGCAMCAQLATHTKALASLPSSLIPTIPASSLTGLYSPHSLIGSSPQVCNWISGDSYCGKRFSSSEELLQHLRTHTSLSTESASSLHMSPLHHPLLSHALPRGYPTPPLSPLSAGRYHPYVKSMSHLPPSSLPASALSVASLSALSPHPLSAYYNPYSLYARSLSATAGLHP